MPANIRLGWKWAVFTNVLAYSAAVLITVVKSFTVQAPRNGTKTPILIEQNWPQTFKNCMKKKQNRKWWFFRTIFDTSTDNLLHSLLSDLCYVTVKALIAWINVSFHCKIIDAEAPRHPAEWHWSEWRFLIYMPSVAAYSLLCWMSWRRGYTPTKWICGHLFNLLLLS